jgi:hypothetical protein
MATARMLDPATASHSLGEMLELGKVAAKEVYAALDWLGREQPFIEATLARRHLMDGALLLYDVTSRLLTGPENTWALAPGQIYCVNFVGFSRLWADFQCSDASA